MKIGNNVTEMKSQEIEIPEIGNPISQNRGEEYVVYTIIPEGYKVYYKNINNYNTYINE